MFSTLKLAIVYLTLGPLAGIVGIPYSLVRGDITLLYKAGMGIVRLGLRAAGVRIAVHGEENIPADRPCIFMANHVSNMDPPVLLPLIPGQTSVLLKASLMRIPILGTAMRMGRFVPVERGSSREAARRSVNAAAEAVRSGLHLVVFPEGTRAKDGRLAAFKKGPFFLAEQTGAPIIPVAIAGTERRLPKGSAAIRPGDVQLTYLPMVDPAKFATREALMRAVHRAIADALPPELRPIDLSPASGPGAKRAAVSQAI